MITAPVMGKNSFKNQNKDLKIFMFSANAELRKINDVIKR